ncbi:hypothetical protein B7494_g5554 [Chlorociboria aeruginascens]|nr:hypothetical protein B7494_g5554 [Chlorociboria aeruginascens]
MGVTFSQFFPPGPSFTEKELPSQKGKVFIVTGGASGVGLELCAILFNAGGKVYMAGRSEINAKKAIDKIKSAAKNPSDGDLQFLHLQLEDLSTIKSTVETFTSKESRLDVLWNNAGVSLPPDGSKSIQGHELQLATNCLGPLLLTKLLLPSLKATSQNASIASVRVIWTFSQIVELSSPTGGFTMDETPGNLKTNLLRSHKMMYYASYPLLHKAKLGAYTELYAGLSPELTLAEKGGLVAPWGRIHPAPRQDLLAALRSTEIGGTGRAKEFSDWCEEKIAEFI